MCYTRNIQTHFCLQVDFRCKPGTRQSFGILLLLFRCTRYTSTAAGQAPGGVALIGSTTRRICDIAVYPNVAGGVVLEYLVRGSTFPSTVSSNPCLWYLVRCMLQYVKVGESFPSSCSFFLASSLGCWHLYAPSSHVYNKQACFRYNKRCATRKYGNTGRGAVEGSCLFFLENTSRRTVHVGRSRRGR